MAVVRLAVIVAVLGGCMSRHQVVVIARVTDPEAERPVRGALITVHGTETMSATDPTGQTPPTLAPARGRLTVSAPGFIQRTAEIPGSASDTVRIDLDIMPDLPRTVYGVVSNTGTRAGIDEARVTVVGSRLSVITGPDGTFLLADFPPGPHIIEAAREEFKSAAQQVVARGGESTRVDFALQDTGDTGRAEGQVLDALSGLPVCGAGLAVDGTSTSATTDSTGRYLLTKVAAGLHELRIFAPGYQEASTPFRIARGWTVTVDVRLDPDPANPPSDGK